MLDITFLWQLIKNCCSLAGMCDTNCHIHQPLLLWIFIYSDPFKNNLNGKSFNSLEDIKSDLNELLAKKSLKFWEDGIFIVEERWRKVVQYSGSYLVGMNI